MASIWVKISNYIAGQWLKLSKRQKLCLVLLCLLLLLIPTLSLADIGDTITKAVLQVLTAIISLLVSFLGKLLALVIHCLVYVAQYNNFINELVVKEGWKVVRDVCNMFFVLGLLLIAFGTVLRLPNYQAKNNLKNFVLGAVLVNFSKTICGLILDFAQIIMLTFVNGFKDVGAGNLTEMLGITSLFEVVTSNPNIASVESIGIFLSYLLALIYLLVALVVIITMTIMLIQRAVMLWLLIVLSPFPYLLSAFPKMGKLGGLSKQWWDKFTGLVTTGPLLAFFIWLSFFTASGTTVSQPDEGNVTLSNLDAELETPSTSSSAFLSEDVNMSVTQSATAQAVIKFLVSIGILVGGMMLTKETSDLVGNIVGGGMKAIKSGGKAATNLAKKGATVGAKAAGRKTLKVAGGATMALTKNATGGLGKSINKVGNFAKTWGEEATEERKKEKGEKRLKTLRKLGMGDKTLGALKEVSEDKTIQNIGRTTKGIATAGLGIALGAATGNPFLAAAMIGGAGIKGFEQSPFSKGAGHKLTLGADKGRIKAHEQVDDEYRAKKQAAVDKYHDNLAKLNQSKDEGSITKEDYQQRKASLAHDRDKELEAAKNEMILGHKMISQPELGQQYQKLETDRDANLREADQRHQARIEAAEAQKNKIINDSETAKTEAQKQYANGSINKETMERLILGANLRVQEANTNYNNTVNNSQKTREADRAKAETDYQRGKEKMLQDNLGGPKGDWLNRQLAHLATGTFLSNLGKSIENYNPAPTTAKAMELGTKYHEDAEENIEEINKATTPDALAQSLDPKLFSGGIGNILGNAQREFLKILSNGQRGSQQAINNLISAVRTLDTNNKKDNTMLLAMQRGINAYLKAGGDPGKRLTPLLKEINNRLPSQSSSK